MGTTYVARIVEPHLQTLAEQWSPLVKAALEELGEQVWAPYEESRGLLRKPKRIARHIVEGPAQRGDEILWAVSHTITPSTFDKRGSLMRGEREFWMIVLVVGSAPSFRIEGNSAVEAIPAELGAFKQALITAQAIGPKRAFFYGNRGPLSHRGS